MKAIILVGGEGTRLRPLTLERPKPVLPVANVPFVERTLRRLAEAGCTEVVLSTCYRAEAFHHLTEHTGVPVRVVVEDEPLGTGGAIGFAAQGFDETFLVLNGDVLTSLDLAATLARHRAFGGQGTLVLTPVEDPSRFGVVPTDEGGRVQEFIEKPAPGTAPTNLINAGTYVLEPSVLERITPGRQVSVEREVFPAMAAAGELFAFGTDDYWLDFGTMDTYVQANVDVLAGLVGEPVPGTERSVGAGRAVVGDGAKLADDVTVQGTVAIGAGATIDAGVVLGPNTALGAGVRVGSGSELVGCVVLDGAEIGSGVRAYGAVIGPRAVVPDSVRLDAGAVVGPDERAGAD